MWAAGLVKGARQQSRPAHLHQEQQKALIEGAFGKLKGFVLTK